MTTPEIEAAKGALAAAEAEVARLQARLKAELADQDARGASAEGRSATADDQPRPLGWSDGVAAARARYPKGRGTGDAPDAVREDQAAEESSTVRYP